MFKKLTALLCLLIALSICIVPVLAADAPLSYVNDYLGYLTETEKASLESQIQIIRKKHNIDAVIVITDDTQGKSSRDFADDYYDYGGYGTDKNASGILMLINMDKPEVWISTTGRAITIVTDRGIENIIDNLFDDLKNERYYAACESFLSDVDMYFYRNSYIGKAGLLLSKPLVYIIPLVVALIVTLILSIGRKGKVTITNTTYEDQDAFCLTAQTDAFIRKTVTTVRITNSSGSGVSGGGGGSSTHTGSSGRSHGGGGRSF